MSELMTATDVAKRNEEHWDAERKKLGHCPRGGGGIYDAWIVAAEKLSKEMGIGREIEVNENGETRIVLIPQEQYGISPYLQGATK